MIKIYYLVLHVNYFGSYGQSHSRHPHHNAPEAGCPAPVLTNRAGRTEMTRSMLCAVGLFLGLLIAPGARAYPTGKVVELTEANFDAEVRPFPHVSLLPRGRG